MNAQVLNAFPRWFRVLLLSAFLAGAAVWSATAQLTLIPSGAIWRYLDDGSDQSTDWIAPGFDDSVLPWRAGPAELGFGDGGEATTNASGHITYYYRHTFNVVDTSSITNLRARLLRDDGAVVYLNGVEVFRSNMTNGLVDYLTLAPATASDDGTVFYPYLIDPARLATGNNVMAVEVHQQSATSSDVSFALDLVGNPVPLIAVTSPTNGQVVVGGNVLISGTATAGGESITLVEAFAGSTKVGESTNATFAILWQNVVPGAYTLRVKATDSYGLMATSAPVTIGVQALPASVLVSRGSIWKYHNLNQDLGTTWRETSYNDSSWNSAPGPLGGGDAHIVSAIDFGPNPGRYPTLYFRRTFTVSSAGAYRNLIMRLLRDDGAIVYLNGTQVVVDGVGTPSVFSAFATQTVDAANESTYFEYTVPPSALVNGTNVLAVEVHQVNGTSSDLGFDLEVEGDVDTTPPTVLAIEPPAGSIRTELSSINVIFDDSVVGVQATDLLINNEAATSVITNSPRDYTFAFPQPATGAVQVVFAANHGITDTSPLGNPFAGLSWTYTLDPNATTAPNVLISEFLAVNDNGIRDEDGQRSDWLELYNLGPLEANLEGWFLTDTPTNLTQWRLPAVVMRNNAYLIIWCSSKDRSSLNAPLHTNFRLGRDAGGYLALVDRRTNVISSFNYPAQTADVAYGRDRVDPGLVGYLSTPTPGAQNSTSGPGILGEPVFSLASGIYTNASLSLTISNTNGAGTIRYTLNATLPNESSTIYTGPLALSVNSTIKARVYPSAGINLLPSAVGARNVIFLDTTAANFSSRWPLMIISTEGRSIPQNLPPGSTNRAKGSLVIIDTVQGRSSVRGASEVHELAEYEIYGQTSAGFAKQPIRIEIQDALGNDLDKKILGMPADSDWRLRNPFNDKTYLNDFLGYELWETMGHYSVRRKFVELFNDTGGGRLTYPGDYYGVMVLCETIKVNNDRVDIPAITPYNTNLAVTDGGFIFKRDKASTGDLNFNSPGGSGFAAIPLRLHEPNVQSMRNVPLTSGESSFPGAGYTVAGTNQLTYLRNFLGTMEGAMYAANWTTRTGTNHYSYYLDPVAFADQMLHVEITKQIDGYRLSDYFTKGRDGRVGPGPVWDWNLAFGNADYLAGGQTNGWYYELCGEADHPWARRLITGSSSGTGTSGDPDFVQLVADRWAMFRTNVLNATNLLKQIDELSTKMTESAARDLYGKYRASVVGVDMWPNPDGTGEGRDVDFYRPTNYFGPIETIAPTNYNGSIIGQMKKWMLGRYLWMDSQFIRVPTINLTGTQVSPGTQVIVSPAPGTTVYYTLDGTDPRLSGGGISPTAQSSASPVTITVNANVRIFARCRGANSWKSTWSGPNAETFYTTIPLVRITEVMFNPAPPPLGNTNDADNFEYVEVKNISGSAVNLNRYQLAGGIKFAFSNVTLQAGQSVVVVKDRAAFASRYNTNGLIIAGPFSGNLANDGDHLVLYDALMVPIHDFKYGDGWHPATDGIGFSLVVNDENGALANWDLAAGWRASAVVGGSPGGNDPAPPARPVVVINEALTHSDTNLTPGLLDTIELLNTGATPADVSGWFLSDDFNPPRKFVIPPGTVIQPGKFVTFTETQFGAGLNGFGLSSDGDEVYLFSGDGVNLTGYAQGFDFGAQANGVTFGRYIISTGNDHFVAQNATTLGNTNTGPLVGPLVITEINYHPADAVVNGVGYNNTADEYIELRNIGSAPVPLYDTNGLYFDENYPGGFYAEGRTNTWRLRDAVDYNFPTNVVVPAGGYLIVVNFDPGASPSATAAFRARNLIPDSIPLYGPWDGDLDNAQDSVELRRPDRAQTNGVPYILVERVKYEDATPWPAAADGLGLTLQRKVPASYGNDPANWAASASTPGGAYVGGTAPVITSQPGHQYLIVGQTYTLSVVATGTPPLRYQWQLNDLPLARATNSSLVFNSIQMSNAGVYNILVYNGGGAALGTNFIVNTRVALGITQQPFDTTVIQGRNASFSVAAVGTGTLGYQWYHDGALIPGATGTSLSLTNAQPADEGIYTVAVSDGIDTVTSNPARLSLAIQPRIVGQPQSPTVAAGGNASFSVQVSGTPPMWYRWRRQGQAITNLNYGFLSSNDNTCVLTLTNVGPATAGRYDCVVSNLVGATPASSNIFFVVVTPPASQTVAPGTAVKLTAVLGLPPPTFTGRFLWQFNGTTIGAGTNVSTTTVRAFTNDLLLPNITEGQSGAYTFLYTNAITVTNAIVTTNPPAPPVTNFVVGTNVIGEVAGFTATVLVASDRDGDGMPDAWETANGLNPDNPSDATQDKDGDGATNLEEYVAGTDPGNAASVLKIVEAAWLPAGEISFQFQAQANRTYTVQYADGLNPILWRKLVDLPARPTDTVHVVTDPAGAGDRYYRVVTPIQP